MPAETSSPSLSYRDLLELPEDGRRRELVDGQLCVMPSPSLRHQAIVANLLVLLRPFVHGAGLGRVYAGPVDVLLTDADVLVPDLVFVRRERKGVLTPGYIRGAPDLVVEVLSPSTTRRDREIKRRLYERAGVEEYWIVDPEAETLEILRGEREALAPQAHLSDPSKRLTTPLLPGLDVALSTIFAD